MSFDADYDVPLEPSTLVDPASAAEAPRLRRLVVIEGPDRGRTFELDPFSPTRMLLGTSPSCEIRLADPVVSRRHLAFEPAGNRFRLKDLGSTNGSFLDGVSFVEAFARGGETLRCGRTALSLEVDDVAIGAAAEIPLARSFGRMIGGSLAMRRLYPLCRRLAGSDVPVIIEGETGTGKEELAEALHEEGPRSSGPFVVFDCTAVSPQLIEAELFGHERGAFTGAVASRAGYFEQASGGTLLIDEIGDMDLPLQAKLLRVIDRGALRRVGGDKTIQVDVRVLCATRRDLDREIAAGRFRDDLFHRLAVARVELPPLRSRTGDVSLLAAHFATSMRASEALTPAVLARFEAYDWPGNVRELRNAVARVVALGDEASAPVSARGKNPGTLEELCTSKLPFAVARRRVIEEFERRYVQSVLAEHDGNVAEAARASGIALRYFQLVRARRTR
jgi:DNA-binding NtrC family response regulator